MKTSTLLLLSLLAFLLLSTIGVDLSLKSTYDKIDTNDPYRGYTRLALAPYKYVKLTGEPFGAVEILPGEKFEMRKQETDGLDQKLIVDWKISGDTLVLNQRMDNGRRPIPSDVSDYRTRVPHVYLFAPSLSGVNSSRIVVRVSHWPGGSFSVVQIGKGILITDNKFEKLSIEARQGAYVAIDDRNALDTTRLVLQDSSKLAVQKDVFKEFSMQMDSATHVDFPGSLLRKSLNL